MLALDQKHGTVMKDGYELTMSIDRLKPQALDTGVKILLILLIILTRIITGRRNRSLATDPKNGVHNVKGVFWYKQLPDRSSNHFHQELEHSY